MSTDEAPEPPGPFYSNVGPREGLIMFGDAPVMGVSPDPDGREFPIGIAWLAGPIPSKRGPIQLWRLTIGKADLEGVWVCRNRQFVRLGEACDREGALARHL